MVRLCAFISIFSGFPATRRAARLDKNLQDLSVHNVLSSSMFAVHLGIPRSSFSSIPTARNQLFGHSSPVYWFISCCSKSFRWNFYSNVRAFPNLQQFVEVAFVIVSSPWLWENFFSSTWFIRCNLSCYSCHHCFWLFLLPESTPLLLAPRKIRMKL